MLNANNERELAYVVKIDDILPHDNADRLEIACVKGWRVIVGKGEFNKGDLAIYFEIDSKLPEIEPWTGMEFLASKHYKIKTQRIRGTISQGFLAHPSCLGWYIDKDSDVIVVDANPPKDKSRTSNYELAYCEGDFLTKELGVTYAVAEDNKRKAQSADKYKAMAQRHPDLARTNWWRWLYKKPWGKKILFFFFGRKKDKKKDWPYWVRKTDEERIESIPWILKMVSPSGLKPIWVATEKIDGSSATYTMRRGEKTLFSRKSSVFYACSRNVVFDTPKKMDKCYYDENVYVKIAERYNIREVLETFLEANPSWEWVTIQGEIFGKRIQQNDYGMNDIDFRIFNLIDSVHGRWGSEDGAKFIEEHTNMKWVPIIQKMELPETIEELREYVRSEKSTLYDGAKEGIVFRSLDGQQSFKVVDPEYLLFFHS